MSHFTTTTGIRLYYEFQQIRNKPTLVLLHGLGCDSTYWKQYFKLFRKDYGILLIDMRGHGRSDRPKKESEYHVESFRDDLTQLLSSLRIKEYFLVGHSFGGVVSREIAKMNPPNLKGIILISTPIDFKDIKKIFLFQVFLARLVPQVVYAKLQRNRHFSQEKNKVMFCIKCLARNGVQTALHIIRNFKNYRNHTKISIPHLAIVFDRDEIIKNHIKQIYRKNLKVLRGSHLTFISKYNEISSIIKAFVSQNTGKV